MTVYDLWLPILVSGAVTHVISTIAWMAMPHHKPEWQPMPSEDEFLEWSKQRGIKPGQYMFPFASDGKQASSDEFKKKQAICTGMLIYWPTPLNMGKAVGFTLASFMIIAFVIGYIASMGLPAGTPFMRVFQFVTTVGLLAHCAANFPHVFWFRRKIAMEVLDGILHALATGLIFAALWPNS